MKEEIRDTLDEHWPQPTEAYGPMNTGVTIDSSTPLPLGRLKGEKVQMLASSPALPHMERERESQDCNRSKYNNSFLKYVLFFGSGVTEFTSVSHFV